MVSEKLILTIGSSRAYDLLEKCIDHIISDHCEGAEALDILYALGFSNSEIRALGFDYLLDLAPSGYERLFIEFLSSLRFTLDRYDDGFALVDNADANLGGIEQERFQCAAEIIERLDDYIFDSIIADIDDALDERSVEITWENSCEAYLEHAGKLLPDDYSSDLDYLDMICNHAEEIDLQKAVLQY